MYFRNYRLWKSCLDHSLKTAVSIHALRVNIWKRPKYLQNLQESAFVMFLIILKEVHSKNVSPSNRWNLASVCWHIDCRWQVFSSRMCDSAPPSWNATIWKIKKKIQNSLFHFCYVHEILNILKQKMIVIANVFEKWQSVKKLLRSLSKERRFRTCFDSQHVKVSEILPISRWQRFYHVFSWFSLKLIW